jgi:tRNA nucleotidyltransferase (CCA-adding enzyme)
MLRLARYAGRLGFSIEPHTRELVDAGALGSVSGPRIGRELRLLAGEDDPVAALEALRELELDRALHPRFGLEDDDLARRALRMLPADGRSERLILGLAGRGVPEAELRTLLDELAFEASDREAILGVATRSDHLAHALAHAGQPSEIAEAASAAEPELVAVAGALGAEDQALEWLERLRDIRLEIDGADLLSAGVPEGPAIGRGLRAALKAKLDGHAAGRDQELEQALQAADASR